MARTPEQAKAEIDRVTAAFFDAFTNKGRSAAAPERIYDLAVPRCAVTIASPNGARSYSLEEFIAPRAALLSNGTLVDFEEYEVAEITTIFGGIAQRNSRYWKSGRQQGLAVSGYGREFFQFVRLDDRWKICAVLYMDETVS
jgi:hypothetical protein